MHRPVTLKSPTKSNSERASVLAHFKALQEEVGGHPVKFTIPSPSMLHLITCVRTPNPQLIERYAGRNDLLLADITAAYVKAVNALYDAGCRILQLDDTSWGEFVFGRKTRAVSGAGGGCGCDRPQLCEDAERHPRRRACGYGAYHACLPRQFPFDMVFQRRLRTGGRNPIRGCNVDGFFWNTTATAPAASNRCASLKTSRSCWGW